MALLPLASFAYQDVNLKGSTQYGTDGFQYVIQKMEKTGDTWTGEVSIKQNNWNATAADKTALVIKPEVKINVDGYYEVKDDAHGVVAEVTFKIVEIEANAFSGLDKIKTVSFLDGCNIEKIGAGAFAGTSIAKLDLTKTKIKTLEKLFEPNNVKLLDVKLPETLEALAPSALADCIQLGGYLTDPEDENQRGGVDFSLCTKLETLGEYSLSNTIVKEYDFSNCVLLKNMDKLLFVNATTKTNKNLEKVILPYITTATPKYSPVEKIGTVFANCEKLTAIVHLEESKITAVADGAFANDISLTSLSFPNTLATVSDSPFAGCKSLAELIFDGTALTDLGTTDKDLFGEYKYLTAWPSTYADFDPVLKSLKITVPSKSPLASTSVAIAKGAFAPATNSALTTVEIAKDGIFKGTIAAGAITMNEAPKNGEEAAEDEVVFGNISGAATINPIAGPKGVYTAKLTVGEYASTTAANAIVTGTISVATIKGTTDNDNAVLTAVGQAKVINFTGNIGGTLKAAAAANNALTTLNFNAIDMVAGAFGSDIFFDMTLAPNLTTMTWNPAAGKETKAFDAAAFKSSAVGAANATITFNTTAAVRKLYDYNEANLHNVIFGAAPGEDATAKDIEAIGAENGTYFYGKVNNTKGTNNLSIAKVQENGNEVVVYSAFVDQDVIYMDALAVNDGKYVVAAGEVAIVRVKQPAADTQSPVDDDDATAGKKTIVKSYEVDPLTVPSTMRYKVSSTETVNDLEITDKVFSSDYIGTTYVGKTLYAMANPAKNNGTLQWKPVKVTQYLPKDAIFVQTTKAVSAPELKVVWLDGNDDYTGIIEKVTGKQSNNNGAIYNLQGVRVSNMSQKGVYIVNGKKYVVK